MWNMLNHLPTKGVERIVTDKILDMDKVSCDRILKSILEEKQCEDMRRQSVQSVRQDLRDKLSKRHHATMALEIKCGVRVGMTGPRNSRSPTGKNISNS